MYVYLHAFPPAARKSVSRRSPLAAKPKLASPCTYTQSPLQDSRLFGPRPWKVLATTYETNGFLSNQDPGESLVMENLVMETGCMV